MKGCACFMSGVDRLVSEMDKWKSDLQQLLKEFNNEAAMKENQLLVIGCSTSEVAGRHIGTGGTSEAAKIIYEELASFRQETGVSLAFQCCEHLNRALVMEREDAENRHYEIVSAVPVPTAGGAMAAWAYSRFRDPAVVEHIRADAGIDIGDTFIGMHLRHVAVPVRTSIKEIGSAHVTMAKTRPKLIGGERAVYIRTASNESCT